MDKNAIMQRALKHHSPTGRVVAALNKIFNTVYPAGTNLILEFLKEFIGMKYGHVNMCMDKVTDCEEMWRITFYIWFGIDIGNFTDAAYKSKLGKSVAVNFNTLSQCRPLDLVFYHTTVTKKTGHVAGIFDSRRIFQSGAASNKSLVNYSPITWLPKGKTASCFKGVKRYLTDEQYDFVIVKENKDMLIKIGDKGKHVVQWQLALFGAGYPGKMDPKLISENNDYGQKSANATKLFQKACGLPETGEVDNLTAAMMWGKARETEITVLKKANDELTSKGDATCKIWGR